MLSAETAPALFGPFGRGLTFGALEDAPAIETGEWVKGATLLGHARQAIDAFVAHDRLEDLPAAASAWAKHHVASIMPGPLASVALGGPAVDVSPQNTAFHVVDGTVRVARVIEVGRSTGDELALVCDSLFRDHLTPLYRHIRKETGLAEKILWGNVGNYTAFLYDRLAEQYPDAPLVQTHRARLTEAETAAWADVPNPLHDPVRYVELHEPGLPSRIQVRRTCCLKLRIRDRTPCATCPAIGDEERIHLLRAHEAGH